MLEEDRHNDSIAEVDERGKNSAGSLLQQGRLACALSEKEVADRLHITVHYVKALEADRFDKLPGAVFAKGYIKSYAELLQLDAEELLAHYQEQQARQQADRDATARQQTQQERDRNRPFVIASVAIVAVLGLGLWFWLGGNAESVPRAEVGAELESAAEVEAEAEIVEQSESTAIQPDPVRDSQPSVAGLNTAVATSLESSDARPATANRDETIPATVAVAGSAEAVPLAEAPGSGTGTEDAQPDSVLPTAEKALAGQSSELSGAQTSADAPGSSAMPAAGATAEDTATAQAGTGEQPAIRVGETDAGERLIEVTATGEDILSVRFSGESWIEVNDAGARLIYRDLREAGDVLEIHGRAPFNILLGDAPLASLSLNGDNIDVSGDIRTDNSARFTVGL